MTFFSYADFSVYAIALLSKGARANFNDAEVAAMAKFAKSILAQRRPKAG